MNQPEGKIPDPAPTRKRADYYQYKADDYYKRVEQMNNINGRYCNGVQAINHYPHLFIIVSM